MRRASHCQMASRTWGAAAWPVVPPEAVCPPIPAPALQTHFAEALSLSDSLPQPMPPISLPTFLLIFHFLVLTQFEN